jgi:hypothetical protein
LRIAVLLVRGKIIVVILVHRGVGPSLFRGRSCAGAWSNTEQPTSARLFHKLLYFSRFLKLIVAVVLDHPDNFQPVTPTSGLKCAHHGFTVREGFQECILGERVFCTNII